MTDRTYTLDITVDDSALVKALSKVAVLIASLVPMPNDANPMPRFHLFRH